MAINTKTYHYYHNSTALHLAVEDNNFEFTKILLDEGILNDEPPKDDKQSNDINEMTKQFNFEYFDIDWLQ